MCNKYTYKTGCMHKTLLSQSSKMSYLKLFTNIYTSVILLSIIIMTDPNDDDVYQGLMGWGKNDLEFA